MKTLVPMAAGLTLLFASRSVAQNTLEHPVGEFVGYFVDSGTLDNPGDRERLVYSRLVDIDQAAWVRLYFDAAELDRGSYLIVTSATDGERQRLDGAALTDWSMTSAYFNGQAVTLELYAAPGSRGNRVALRRVAAEFPAVLLPGGPEGRGSPGQCGICGTDDRTPSSEAWSGRILPIGCTGSIYCPDGGVVTAGHCSGGSGLVVQFNVPPSLSNCATVNPPVADQFPVTTQQFVNGGVGNDWGVMRTGNNSAGQNCFQHQGQMRAFIGAPANVNDVASIYGYGVDQTCTRSQTQQFSPGTILSRTSNYYTYSNDVRGGNSGSGFIVSNQIAGIVTHCVAGTCGNIATRGDLAAFVAARNALCIVCACDWNHNGILNSQDFFDFVTDFFNANGDFNHDGITNSQDYFDFLNCFFTGCP